MAEKVSLRQAGKEITGKLYKGPIIDAYNRLSQPSIPTRIEQILTTPSKSEGFNCSAQRFHTMPNAMRAPGPADYNCKDLSNPSISKKGYLMSSSSRFKKNQYKTPVPGPGSYNLKSARTLGIIISGRGKSLAKTAEIPSPGYYDPRAPISTKEATSMFKSTSKRMASVSKADLPSPWQYNPRKPQRSEKKLTSPFVIPSNRRREQINLYDPHAKPSTVITPGPGEYSMQTTTKSRPSSMFLANDLDRFGKTTRKRTKEYAPGPGEYSVEKENSKSLVTGAAFVSESKRGWIKADKKPPGPAFYNPAPVPKKKSFHLKPRKQWIWA